MIDNDSTDFFPETIASGGIYIASVAGGHMIKFNTYWLKNMLESLERNNKKNCEIFVRQHNNKIHPYFG